jgi:hypothetical protein
MLVFDLVHMLVSFVLFRLVVLFCYFVLMTSNLTPTKRTRSPPPIQTNNVDCAPTSTSTSTPIKSSSRFNFHTPSTPDLNTIAIDPDPDRFPASYTLQQKHNCISWRSGLLERGDFDTSKTKFLRLSVYHQCEVAYHVLEWMKQSPSSADGISQAILDQRVHAKINQLQTLMQNPHACERPNIVSANHYHQHSMKPNRQVIPLVQVLRI